MNARSLAALVAINAALLAALVVSLFSPQPAQAQFGGGNQYLMIAGETVARNDQAMIYVIDLRTSAMVAMLFNSANNELELVGGRMMADDFRATPGARR